MADHPLVQLFGDTARVRLLAAMLEADQPRNPTAICEAADVGRQTWYSHVDDFEALGVVECVQQAGNSPLYAMTDSDEVAALRELATVTAGGGS